MTIRRTVLGILSLLFVATSMAATLAERSPFTQGHWWNPARSGNGFEIFNSASQAMVIWYTYDAAGRPTWYTAQGDVATLGTQERWPLLRHRWANGRKAGYELVGTLRLDVRHAEAIDVFWEVGGKSGMWSVQPFTLSGTVSEIDHTGSWFDPGNSGWGFTFTEQGDVIGGVLYTYDVSGSPTWAAGFERNTASIELFTTQGACPSCTYTPTVTRSAGRLALDFRGEGEMILRNNLTLPMADGVNVNGATVMQLSRAASMRPADRQLASFDSAQSLKTYLDAGMLNVTSAGSGADFAPAPPATAFSLTNLQEAGVDEADVVKSNGRHLYTYATGNYYGNFQPAVRIAKVGSEGAAFDVRGSVALRSGTPTPLSNAGLFLSGDTLVSLAGSVAYAYTGSPWIYSYSWTRGQTHVEVMSLANPDLPQTVWHAQIDGYIVASRRIGDRLYVVSRHVPYLPLFYYGAQDPAYVAQNRTLLANTPLSALLPSVRINGGDATPLVAATSVFAPPQGGRKPLADMVVITAIDLASPRVAQSIAIVGAVETVYASTTDLFVASSRYELRSGGGQLLPEPAIYLTDLHQIRLGANAMTIVGSGSVEGYLSSDPDKAPFRLSAHEGKLRAVTSSQMWNAGKNRVSILEPSAITPGLLKLVSHLPNAKRPAPLGKPNEMLYGVRFMGERLYAVTFKKVDPLYVVDLSDVSDPRIAGELQIPGFSDYLHPLANGLLLGFGKDARPSDSTGDGQFAWFQGLQLTLFDVADATQPREIQRVLIGKRGSDSALLRHHHAFSMLTLSDGLSSIGIPARIHDGENYGYSDSTSYPWKESGLARFELRGRTPADARLVPMPSLVSHRATDPNAYYAPNTDASHYNARSILFRDGTIYVGNGQFWHQDKAGITVGPF